MTCVELSPVEFQTVEVCPDLIKQRWHTGLMVGFRLDDGGGWAAQVQWSRGVDREPTTGWFGQDQVRGAAAAP